MKIFTPRGFHSAQHLVFFVCYTKHVEALAALALRVAAKSRGKSHVPLASLGEQRVPVDPWQGEGRVQGQRESMTRPHRHFSSWKAIVLLLVELCSCGLSSLLVPVPAGHPLALGSPLYLPVVGSLFLLLLFLMR